MPSSSTISTSRFAAALSTLQHAHAAAGEASSAAMAQLGATPDFAVLFASSHYREALGEIAQRVCQATNCQSLMGCTGESIVGGDREIEDEPAVSLWLASLPGTTVNLMHLEFERTPDGGSFTGWRAELAEPWPPGAAMLLLGDPFSFPADELVRRMNEDRPGVPVLGGMASGGAVPGENYLVLGNEQFQTGAVAALVHGAVRISSVVSQGCRPIGQPFVVTRAEANVIHELGGVPPLLQLKEMFKTLTEREQQLVRHGLHVGRVLNEYQDEFRRGDFLVRNVIGADSQTGAIAIGDYIRPGQTVQFHVRDEETADEDLRHLLKDSRNLVTSQPRGTLLFTCNGRGTRLFSLANHDARCVRQSLGEIPLAGFFAQGEIGPVAGKNFLHGFTASVAIFE